MKRTTFSKQLLVWFALVAILLNDVLLPAHLLLAADQPGGGAGAGKPTPPAPNSPVPPSAEKDKKSAPGEKDAKAPSTTQPSNDVTIRIEQALRKMRKEHSQKSLEQKDCLASSAAIRDMKSAFKELEVVKKMLKEKERELEQREKQIAEQVDSLKKLRDDALQAGEHLKDVSQEKVSRVVDMLFAMNPKASAKVLAALNEELAVAALVKMDTVKLGKILNWLEPKRAARLSERVAGMKAASKSSPSSSGHRGRELSAEPEQTGQPNLEANPEDAP